MPVRRFHYAWIIVAVTLVTLMAAQAVRAAPGIIIVPLEREFGWDRASISLAVAVSLLAFGLGGRWAAACWSASARGGCSRGACS